MDLCKSTTNERGGGRFLVYDTVWSSVFSLRVYVTANTVKIVEELVSLPDVELFFYSSALTNELQIHVEDGGHSIATISYNESTNIVSITEPITYNTRKYVVKSIDEGIYLVVSLTKIMLYLASKNLDYIT